MASSKKTLDVNILTFETMYIKAQTELQISSYTIPMIPSGDTVLKQLIYLSPHQALSVANIYITPSTIPNIINEISSLSSTQIILLNSVSTASTLVGNSVSTINSTMNQYTSSIYNSIYNSTYSTLAGRYLRVEIQNISTLVLQANVTDLSNTVSTLSTQYISTFNGLYSELDLSFNQGPSVSALSTYLTQYFSSLAITIPYYSTTIGASISTTTSQNNSSLLGYYTLIDAISVVALTDTISSFSTIITSSFNSYETILDSYNPASGISSISTNVVSTLYYFSTQFIINSGIPGICSLSTTINQQYIENLNNLQGLAGTPGLCTMSTYLTDSVLTMSQQIATLNTGGSISSFSTSLYQAIDQMNIQMNTAGYLNTILQQEEVKESLSTLSTSFGISYNDMLSYSSLSTMIELTYQFPNLTIGSLSTFQGSNISTISSIIVSTYPSIYCGPGVSSLSTAVSLSFSTLSTSIGGAYQSYFNLTSSIVSSFTSTNLSHIARYSSISSILYQNLVSPMFSTFITNSINVSTLKASSLTVSSLGINQSTSVAFPFAVIGGAQILPALAPPISYVKIGLSTFTGSSAQLGYTSTATNQFTAQGNDVAWNGSQWVAVGSNVSIGNPIKYSSTPSVTWTNATYTVSPTSTQLPRTLNTVKWNGSYWLAGGSGASTKPNNLLSSFNGSTWTFANPATMMSSIQGLSWNGYKWVAVGADPTISSILYTDTNGIWQQTSNAFSSKQGNDITNNGRTWVAVGNGLTGLGGAMKYSFDAITWSNVVGQQLSTGTTVAWNGDKFVAAGSNGNLSNVVYSFDGVNWEYSAVPNVASQATSIVWDGSQWNLTGLTDSTHFVSADGIQWSNSLMSNTGTIYGQAYAANTIPSIQLSNLDIFSQETPAMINSRKRINIIQSSIFFNDGDLTIRTVPSTMAYACVGINNTYPTVALDIGYGDARKPSGTDWLTASDRRVKENIVMADLASCAKLVADIPLRQYSFTKEYQAKTRVSGDSQYGFIAQEVKAVLPNSIRYSEEFGLSNFHSLDTDQIFKAEFGATQYLLQKLHGMEAHVSTLESRLKSPAA